MTSDIISLTEFKNDAAGWIRRLQKQPPVVLTQNGHGTAVVQSYEAYRQVQFELALMRRALRAEADHRAGRTVSHEQMMAEVRELLGPNLAATPPARKKRAPRRG